MNFRKKLFMGIVGMILIIAAGISYRPLSLPIIAIANYGPHSSLFEIIAGMQSELAQQGYIDEKTIHYKVTDVGFNQSLIPQMITALKQKRPTVLVTLATPVAQFAKHAIKDFPLVFSAVTDPVAAGLVQQPTKTNNNITGVSDKQNILAMLDFAKRLLPNAKKIGILHATSEANDLALVKHLSDAAVKFDMQLVAIPIDEARDIPLRIQMLANKVDFIYVGTSGTIQPSLPVIAKIANTLKLPIINADSDAVKNQRVLASFGVDYHKLGIKVGQIVAKILQNEPVTNIKPYYPKLNDHHGFISKKQAHQYGISMPQDLANTTIVE